MIVPGQNPDRWEGTRTESIEALLQWAFGVEMAHRTLRKGSVGPAGYTSAWNGIGRRAALGVAVDCLWSGLNNEGLVHDSAVWIAERVQALGGVAAALVVEHARAGTRPELCEDVPRMVARRGYDGKPVIILDGHRWIGSYCVIDQDPLPEHREFCRQRWMLWWDALDTLAMQCGCESLAEPREPWIAEK